MATHKGTKTIVNVDYRSRTWFRPVETVHAVKANPLAGLAGKSLLSPALHGVLPASQESGQLRQALAHGQLSIVGHPVLDGQSSIEISDNTTQSKETLWIDASTYLPLQESVVNDNGVSFETTFRWLAPTATNLGLLQAPIPPGFRQVPVTLPSPP
ncbi:MAG: hypothetical protein ACRDZQ_11215 [Acidimicrobiales bacterium]